MGSYYGKTPRMKCQRSITVTSYWVRWRLKSTASRLFTQPFDSGADQRKHQSSASLVLVRGIRRWPVNSPHKAPVTRKMCPFDDVIMFTQEVSKPRDLRLELSDRQRRFEIWQATKTPAKSLKLSISGLPDFTRSYDKTFYQILKRTSGYARVMFRSHFPMISRNNSQLG